ncbi:MAG: hypothetical protein A2096_08025 [Spirochaetes bacterium GWF1_41_5]|nr:MAG: hypothetical protein A2096_08025 [Spirochaetes bacterium GWF1_41_5]
MTGLTFLTLFLLIMLLIAIVPKLLNKFYIPSIIAIMLTGIIIGPNCLDLIKKLNHFLGRGYPTQQLYTVIEVLGYLGLIFLMSLAGMECNLKIMRSEKKTVFWLSLFTFLIPAAAGFLVYRHFRREDIIGQFFYASLFASHSVGIVFPIIRELKLIKTRFGVAILSATIITDMASLILLAFCVQLKRHSLQSIGIDNISILDHLNINSAGPVFYLLFTATIALYLAGTLWLVPHIGKWIFSRIDHKDDSRLTFFLATVLSVVLIGELAGVSVIVSAFIAGMALSGVEILHEHGGLMLKKIEGTGYGFFIPFMFLATGMKTDIASIAGAGENISIVLWTFLGLTGSKIISGWIAMLISGFSHRKSLLAGLMTVPQLSATLAAATVGLSLGIISGNFFNAVIILSILTTIPVPILVKLIIEKSGIKFNEPSDKLSSKVDVKFLEDELL